MPSFDLILKTFGTGEAFFPETDLDEIQIFFENEFNSPPSPIKDSFSAMLPKVNSPYPSNPNKV
jgi:hypothetical protein